MTTQQTDQPQNQSQAKAPSQDPRRFGPAVVITTAALGGVALLGVGASAVWGVGVPAIIAGVPVGGSATVASTVTSSIDGITELDVEAGRGELVIEFADVEEAVLDVESRDTWTMQRESDELVVQSRDTLFDFGFDLCWSGCEPRRVTLTLPRELEGLDAELSLGAGSLTADGAFGDVKLDVGAGEAKVSGSARAIDAEISAGAMEVDLADVREASFDVSAGKGEARLSGRAPDTVEIEVSAGSLALELPDAVYAVSADSSAGTVENALRTDPSSRNRVTADVSAGSLTLRSSSPR